MKTIMLNLNEKHKKRLIQTFLSNYPNYTINFVNSKEIPTNCREIERNTLWICDRDLSLISLQAIYNDRPYVPVIAFSHQDSTGESLMKAPWLILSPESLTPQLIEEVICRSESVPLTIMETSRCIIRELADTDLTSLRKLQVENKNNPAGCFFPESCAEPDVFLHDYIKYQYPFYGFGLFAIFLKTDLSFVGIAGFSPSDRPDVSAAISYSLLMEYQHHGYAREVVRALIKEGMQRWELTQIIAEINPDHAASIRLAKDLELFIVPPL